MSAQEWLSRRAFPVVVCDIARWVDGCPEPNSDFPEAYGEPRFAWYSDDGLRAVEARESFDLVVRLRTLKIGFGEASVLIHVGTKETAGDIFEWLRTGILPE